MKTANRIARIEGSKTLQVKEKALELQAQGIEIVDLTAGEPDFNTPDYICQAGIEAIRQGFTKYTANNGMPALRKKIVEKLKKDNGLTYTPEQIIVSNGAKQSILNALLATVDDGDEVILPSPYWVSYPEQIKIAGGVPKIIDTSGTGFKLKADQLQKVISAKSAAIILNSPCNPTGVVYDSDELRALADVLKEYDIWIISDEIYEKIIFDGLTHTSIASFDGLIDRCIVINGVSKSYSMTGWRLGYAAGPLAVVKAMSKIQSHYTSNASSISQKAAIAALDGPTAAVEQMRKTFEERRDYIHSRLSGRPYFSYVHAQGAFYSFINVSQAYGNRINNRVIGNSVDICSYIAENFHLLTVPGIAFGADQYIRLSYAASMENLGRGMDNLIKAMDQLMSLK